MAKKTKTYSHVQATEALEQLGREGTSAHDFIYDLLRIFAGYGDGQVRRTKEGPGNLAKDGKTVLVKNLVAYRPSPVSSLDNDLSQLYDVVNAMRADSKIAKHSPRLYITSDGVNVVAYDPKENDWYENGIALLWKDFEFFTPLAGIENMPNLFIIAGCNGAGKTTASFNVLPQILNCREFVNADEIAKGISPFAPESVAIQAGKLMLQRIETLLAGNVSFAIETTLSTRSYQSLVRRAKSMGYTVQLLFFWLESPEIAVRRVERRVSEGGHNIPFDTVYRRYHAGLRNLFNIFMPIVDYWALYDNNLQARLIADSEEVQDNETFNKIKNNYV